MKVCAIVPVKPFQQAKSRLSPVLRKPLRAALARALLMRTLDTLQATSLEVLVISRDLMALKLAGGRGVQTLMESGYDLNAALTEARAWAMRRAAEAVLVLPADLPLLRPGDIAAMLALACDPPCSVIAPDRRNSGTNALLLRPPDALPFAFGPGSLVEHCARAERARARLCIYRSPTLAFDLDTPQDLAALPLYVDATM